MKCAPFGKVLALLTNTRLGWKGLLFYLIVSDERKKSFIPSAAGNFSAGKSGPGPAKDINVQVSPRFFILRGKFPGGGGSSLEETRVHRKP